MLEKEEEDIKKIIVGREFDSHYLLFSFILAGINKTEDVDKIGLLILTGLQIIIPDLVFENKQFKIKGKFLNERAFNEIVLILFKALDRKKIIINKDDDPLIKREKEMKLKAQKIRRNARNNEATGNSIEDMLVSILYEFQQYSLEDLFELNIYTIYYLFGYVGKIANYEVSKIAFGTGNYKRGKKHKYFVEK
ncbi:hypothetical protein DRO61_05260 [Candidatus Bathyarchaeota archaeon]|nr:MAG: hypothetical protein DRO61_05260 [Candidatus Bathyarchaeota archaeon]